MALETLKGVEKLGQFPVVVMDELRTKYPDKFNESGAMDYPWFEREIRPKFFIYVRHDANSIAFTLQKGPVRENGVNGCQVDTLIEAAYSILAGLNAQVHHKDNEFALIHLEQALQALQRRTKDRVLRNVEGTDVA